MAKSINYILIAASPVATSADQQIRDPLFTHSPSPVCCCCCSGRWCHVKLTTYWCDAHVQTQSYRINAPQPARCTDYPAGPPMFSPAAASQAAKKLLWDFGMSATDRHVHN